MSLATSASPQFPLDTPRPRSIGTALACPSRMGPELTEEELRRSVRERVTDGRLFWATGAATVRRGTGRPCNVCGKAIGKESIEREVQGPREGYALTHEDCYKIWREESRQVQAPPPPG